MSRRRPSKWQRPVGARPALGGTPAPEERNRREWVVSPGSGAAAANSYRCPGCDQQILPATPHVVVWPENPSLLAAIGGAQSLDERRHWHTACWQRRR